MRLASVPSARGMDDAATSLDAQRLERLLAAGRALVSELDLDAVLEQRAGASPAS